MSIRGMLKGMALVVIALLALTTANGCGGGGDGSSSTPAESGSAEATSGGESPDSSKEGGGSSAGSADGASEGSPGGSDDSSGSSPGGSSGAGEGTPGAGEGTPPSQTTFAKQAQGVCTKINTRFENEAAKFIEGVKKNPPKPTEKPPELTLVETVFVPRYQEEIDALGSLEAPAAEADEFSAFLDALQEVVDGASDDPQAFIESEGDFGPALRKATKLGFPNCAQT